MRKLAVLLLAGALLAVSGIAMAQDVTPPPVEELMTPELMELTGLIRLTPQELERLNSWLRVYAQSVLDVYGPSRAPAQPSTSPNVIESRIDGTFEGWDGDTVFRLMNGQIWQQAEYDYFYSYAYMPKVTIVSSGGGYLMQVEGARKAIAVIRIK